MPDGGFHQLVTWKLIVHFTAVHTILFFWDFVESVALVLAVWLRKLRRWQVAASHSRVLGSNFRLGFIQIRKQLAVLSTCWLVWFVGTLKFFRTLAKAEAELLIVCLLSYERRSVISIIKRALIVLWGFCGALRTLRINWYQRLVAHSFIFSFFLFTCFLVQESERVMSPVNRLVCIDRRPAPLNLLHHLDTINFIYDMAQLIQCIFILQ